MLVRDYMNKFPICIGKMESVESASKVMQEKNIRHLPVVDEGRLVGLLSYTDVVGALPSKVSMLEKREATYLFSMVKVKDALPQHQQVITINADACIEEAALLMRSYKIGSLPVLEEGKLVGILTEEDIFEAFIDLLGVRSAGSRITVVGLSDEPGNIAAITEVINSFDVNITRIAMFPTEDADKKYSLLIRLQSKDIYPVVEALKVNGYQVESSFEYNHVFSHLQETFS